MGEKEKIVMEITWLIDDYNAICAKKLLQHRLRYNNLNEQLVLANREQLAYGSYQCELTKGAENALAYLKAAIKVFNFEYGE